MKEHFNGIIHMKKIKSLYSLLFMVFLLVASLNFISSSNQYAMYADVLDFSEQSGEETKEDIKNYDCVISTFNYELINYSELQINVIHSFPLQHQFTEIITTPPECS